MTPATACVSGAPMADRRRLSGGTDRTAAAERRIAVAGWGLALAAALAVYGATMAPDLVWQDAGDYQWQAARMNLSRPGDAVRVHPFYVVVAHGLGRIGVWNYARGASVASAVGTALAVANVWLLVWLLMRRPWPATVAALVCMLAHTVWQQGVQPQTYGWSNAAMSGMLVLAVAHARTGRIRWLLVLALVGGVGLSVHLMSQLALAVLGVWVVWRMIRRDVPAWVLPAGLGLWLLGGGLFWYVVWGEVVRTGEIAAALESAFIGRWGSAVFNVTGLPRMLLRSVLMFVLNFPTLLVLLGFWGLWRSRRAWPRMPHAALLAAVLVVYVLFAVRYRVPNQNFFFTPVYVLAAVYIGVGVGSVTWARRPAAMAAILTAALLVVPAYWVMMRTARATGFNLKAGRPVRKIPYRDDYVYYLLPWQTGNDGARRFAEEALDSLPRGAVLFADSTSRPPLLCVQKLEGRRPDVRLVASDGLSPETVARYWGSKEDLLAEFAAEGRRVFIVSDHPAYMPAWMAEHARRVPFGIVFEATEKAGGPPAGEAK